MAYATPTQGDPSIDASVSISKQPMDFEHTPFMLNGEIMVPAKTFFEKLGTQIWWYNNRNELVTYQDNTFIKFHANSKWAQINGKSVEMSLHAMMLKEELFIPASFVIDYYGLNYELDSLTHNLSINYREDVLEYRQFGYRHFRRVNLAHLGFSFYMPEYWQTLDSTLNTYGVEGSYETYRLTSTVYSQALNTSRSAFKNNVLSDLRAQYGDALQIVSQNTQKFGEYVSEIIQYDLYSNGEVGHYIEYLFYENNNGYRLSGYYADSNDQAESLEVYDTIAKTFSIPKLSINESLEHYTELPNYFAYGIQLSNSLYSNMPVKNQFELTGVVDQNKVKGFHVIVTKDANKTSYYIPVKEGVFGSKIYTPFGLGKHNVKVIVDLGVSKKQSIGFLELPTATLDDFVKDAQAFRFDEASSDIVLKFSVLNTSSEPIRNILQSIYVNYDYTEIYFITNSLTFNLTNQYSKAKELYEWIVENYQYLDGMSGSQLRDAREMAVVKSGNSIELCFLYTALLRSTNIPAKIMRGNTGQEVLYWVETYLNGEWTIASIAEDVKSGSGTANYFYLDRTMHYDRFDQVEALDF